MKLRHAAALALLGWYLMLPPRIVDRFYPDAPLSQWKRFGQTEYANKEQCEAERESLRDRVKDVDAEKLPPERYTARTMVRGLNAVQCIASDDPRLKEK
jgi:hypothetical protein